MCRFQIWPAAFPSDRRPSSLLPPVDETSPIDDAWIFIVNDSESGGASSPHSDAPAHALLIEPSSGPSRTRWKTRLTNPDPDADPDNKRESVASDPFEHAPIIDPEKVSIKEVFPASNLPDIPSLVYHPDGTNSFGIEIAEERNGDAQCYPSSVSEDSSSALTRVPTGSPIRKPSTRRRVSAPLLSIDTNLPFPNRSYSASPTKYRPFGVPFPLAFTSSLSPIPSDSEAPSPADTAPLTTNYRPKSRKRGSDGSTLSKGSAYLGGQALEAQRWIIRTAAKGAKGIRSAASTKKVGGGGEGSGGGSKEILEDGGDEATELKRRIEERERHREREKEEWRVLADGLQERKIRGSAGKHIVVQGRRGIRAERDDQLRRRRRCIWIGVVLGVVAFVLVGVGCLLWHLRQQRSGANKPNDHGSSNNAGGNVIPPTPPPNNTSTPPDHGSSDGAGDIVIPPTSPPRSNTSTPPILPDIHNLTNTTDNNSSRLPDELDVPDAPPCPPKVPPCPSQDTADVEGINCLNVPSFFGCPQWVRLGG
ncbi:hypothetical protein MVLG_06405 [Microbotryum lychnidis-dioicae p1A1 Lamole]|uniref:Uncharacterized protein n=1 Tax=Microbotryum lychnidis-dioicae (strain p1A1 Lamole / MvSl-1064) TaxID=683840 RepID=U5HH65_USTV1|nr:hypothetical protein MVLG_06405 [Microbotryum lychnidis-dioicae p1A1 Lamole]|eukprot:KDE03082.1 hypothetical protein MVLG_06405 [Microbotryum lychnidis-dioicae p1A1 Lamole]